MVAGGDKQFLRPELVQILDLDAHAFDRVTANQEFYSLGVQRVDLFAQFGVGPSRLKPGHT